LLTAVVPAPVYDVDILRNINLQVKRGSLVAVIGSVGSGKSTLLAGLLGELKRTQGRVRIRGSVGYCPQQAWIQNASLRDNMYMTSNIIFST
jgi:ABC-type Mn2+/Zn2+ transport system ATPase subunit